MNKHEITKLTIMEWNIHQKGCLYNKITPLPTWIIDEFEGRDIVILTEYCHRNSKSVEFVQKIRKIGYNCVFSTNKVGNDILIAIKDIYQIVNVQFVPCGGIDCIPENLRVDIKVGNDILSVIGVRIKEFSFWEENTQKDFQGQAQKRATNMKWLMHWIKDITNSIVIAGDFNNYRTDTPLKEWNIYVIDNMSSGFKRETPDGSSIFKYKNSREFPEDHFLFRGIELNKLPYDRNFVKHNRTIYQNGKSLENISLGYPDHAILKGTIEI